MADAAERAVLRTIEVMRDRLGEPLTVDDLAKAAMFSKFHFTRLFQRVTGISPGRFLSALRLQQAKHLLVSTGMNVADISVEVGYNSVGTFSSRFSRSVGMSPTAYRRRAGFAPAIHVDAGARAGSPSNARLTFGLHTVGPDGDAPIFAGLFPGPIPEGPPVRCAVLDRPGRVSFSSVPLGTWYLLAQSVGRHAAHPVADCACPDRPVSVASHGPVLVRSNSVISADLVLRPMGALDPPVLLALLDVRTYARATQQAEQAGRSPYLGEGAAA
ncbi:AraC family transcriptional regulator [Micromonospora sp. WMMD1082]|uniref:helix-turn-helix domain-containing protein n=1 Tax=Micromonospora sp. WMMD1082 TaxID=3016104 RepID=UPI0024179DBB|nr:AraC family transcriptional regulator [Micromonospora sp. WMMD1082]MDG4793449.1 AraC family transcriptional regulator [Micromonospora sp. WMMD1082]